MSGFDNRKEEWTRKKSYLLRSLFEDDLISTISEQDESQRSLNSPSGNYATQHPVTRDWSPLPDLIIEVVPRRPKIYDDEPEEFYKSLEKEIKKLCRRDYLYLFSSSSDSSRADSQHKSQSIEEDESFPDFGGDRDLEESINAEDDPIARNELNRTIDKLSTEKSTSTSSFGSDRMIETTAIIEKEMHPSDDQMSKEDSVEAEESSDEDEPGDDGQSMELTENDDARPSHETVSTVQEPDAMRRQEARTSFLSLSNHHYEKSPEKIALYQGQELVFMDESNDRISNIKTRDFSRTVNATSTPNSRESGSFRLSGRKSSSNRFEPYSPSSSCRSFESRCDRAVQTSFSDAGSENSLWRNYFIGTPTFFRLQELEMLGWSTTKSTRRGALE